MNKQLTAFNFITLVQYSGQNAGLVGNGELNAFATFNQIKQAGYKVNKGAKSISVFCGYKTTIDKKTGDEIKAPVFGRVFDLVDTTANDHKEFVDWLTNEAEIQPDYYTREAKLAQAVAI